MTIQGALYGSDDYQNNVSLDGAVTNQGTVVIDSPNVSTDVSAGVQLNGSPLVNDGTLDFTDESPTLIDQINTTVTNQAAGTINLIGGRTWFDAGQTDTNAGTIVIAPGADLAITANPFLSGPTTFINSGTISPQVSAAATGAMTLGHDARVTLGGTVAPQLVGGYIPAAGTEIQAFPVDPSGLTLAGSFAATTGGFTADYSHETGDAPNYIGLIYQQAPPAGATTVASTPGVSKPRVRGAKVTIVLSCPTTGNCPRVSITATVTQRIKHKRGKAGSRKVVVGSTSVTLRAGAKQTVSVTLNRIGARLLARSHRLKLRLSVTVGGRVTKSFTLTLTRKSRTTKRKAK